MVWSLGREDPLKEGTTTHSSILAWRIPWTEQPGRLQSIGLQRPRHDWSDRASKLSSCSWHWASPKTWERYHLPPPSTVLYSVAVSSAQSTFPAFLFKMFHVIFFFIFFLWMNSLWYFILLLVSLWPTWVTLESLMCSYNPVTDVYRLAYYVLKISTFQRKPQAHHISD